MKLFKIVTFFIFLFISISTACQDKQPRCSEVIEELSYYWKLDSLANNGFRYYAYHKFLACSIDSVNREQLFKKLGSPNQIREEKHVVLYLYNYFDIRNYPKDYVGPMTCRYVYFVFDYRNQHLISIDIGDLDL